MNTSLLRKLSIGIASLAISSVAFGAMDMDSRVTQLENQMQQVRTKTPMGTYGAKTASARPNISGCYGWFLTADVLVWHPKLGGTDYVYKANGLNAEIPLKAEAKGVNFDWDWGFRVGIGYNFKHDGWDLGLKYTYFKPDDTQTVSAVGNQSTLPTEGATNLPNWITQEVQNSAERPLYFNPAYRVAASAKKTVDITYHNLDLELGRAYYVSRALSMRPHWGVRTSWLNIESRIRYAETPSCPGMDQAVFGLGCNDATVNDDSDFWGIGPRAGVKSKWYLGNGISIFGNVAGALLFGFFDVDHCESNTLIRTETGTSNDTNIRSTNPSNNRFNLSADRHFVVPTVQLFAGLRYDSYINQNKQHIGLGLGYEINYWWRIDQSMQINDAATSNYKSKSEDLAFYGITLNIKLDF
ncbi:MAG: Lpg1974 family pore-forming outer membrane protein [Chlamydiota bacterium]